MDKPSLLNLIWDLRELAFEGFSRGWDSLDQRDKHAEIDRVVDGIKTFQNDELLEIASLLRSASRDERGVLLRVAQRLMSKGRDNYGPMHLRNDARDFGHEMAEEAVDALIYWACDVIQKRYREAPRSDEHAEHLQAEYERERRSECCHTPRTEPHADGCQPIVTGPHALVDFEEEKTGERCFDVSDVEAER